MKNGLRGCLGSFSMVCALHVVALLLRSERLEAGRPIILEALCVMFAPTGGSYHGQETGGHNRREWIGLLFCRKATEGGGNRMCFEFVDGRVFAGSNCGQ